MKKLALIALVLAACGGKKNEQEGKETAPTPTPTPGSSTGSGSAAASGSATAGSGSATAGSGSATAGSGSSTAMAGSGSGSAAPDDGIKFDKLPDGWEAGGGKLDTFEAVNDSKFPVDNASFVFEYAVEAKDMPTDPKEYAAVLDKGGFKVTKNEKTANGHYYESEDAFRYVVVAGDKRIHCGGSLYKSDDYNKIPAVRDKVVAEAKKICQTAKL
jgi:hypothetical protein